MSRQKRVTTIDIRLAQMNDRIAAVERRLADASNRGCQKLSTYGTRVALRYGSQPILWYGVVIPRPADSPLYGLSGEVFVWVLTDAGQIRGCYPGNLCLV